MFGVKIDEVLGENADLFKEHYYVKKPGNCDLSSMSDPHNEFAGKNVLIERNEPSAMASKFGLSVEKYQEILGECGRKLFDVRLKRPKPHLDDKVKTLLGESFTVFFSFVNCFKFSFVRLLCRGTVLLSRLWQERLRFLWLSLKAPSTVSLW